jgi:hypothetical protein
MAGKSRMAWILGEELQSLAPFLIDQSFTSGEISLLTLRKESVPKLFHLGNAHSDFEHTSFSQTLGQGLS